MVRVRVDDHRVDVAVVGGGFFGASIACHFAEQGASVLVIEREPELMQRASFANQARVHGGYHYPRSVLTALRSRVNLPEFVAEFSDCIDTTFDKYYAIARQFSKVSGEQFRRFCTLVDAPITRAPQAVQDLFDPTMVEDVFTVQEYAFDSEKLRVRIDKKLAAAGARCLMSTEAVSVARVAEGLRVTLDRDGATEYVHAGRVFNCTYSRVNELHRRSSLPVHDLKHEVAEIALVKPPAELDGIGITMMCGPFFSMMPFPSRGLYSFTHVRYTPHTEWFEQGGTVAAGERLGAISGPTAGRDPYHYLESIRPTSAFPKMLADAKRYIPLLAKVEYQTSLYEVKTVLPQSEGDDSRPILFKENHGLPGYTCVVGAKIDNIYDVYKELG